MFVAAFVVLLLNLFLHYCCTVLWRTLLQTAMLLLKFCSRPIWWFWCIKLSLFGRLRQELAKQLKAYFSGFQLLRQSFSPIPSTALRLLPRPSPFPFVPPFPILLTHLERCKPRRKTHFCTFSLSKSIWWQCCSMVYRLNFNIWPRHTYT